MKTVKSKFPSKCNIANTIILTGEDITTKNKNLIADTLINYIADIAKAVKLKKQPNFLPSINEHFKNNENLMKIREEYDTQENLFLFTLFF